MLKTMRASEVKEGDVLVQDDRRLKVTFKDFVPRRLRAEPVDLRPEDPVEFSFNFEQMVDVSMDDADPRLGPLELAKEEMEFHFQSEIRATATLLQDGTAEKLAGGLADSIRAACFRDLKDFHRRMVESIKGEGFDQARIMVLIQMVKGD